MYLFNISFIIANFNKFQQMFNKYSVKCNNDLQHERCVFDKSMLNETSPIFNILETPYFIEANNQNVNILIQILRLNTSKLTNHFIIVSLGSHIPVEIYNNLRPSLILDKQTNTFQCVEMSEKYTHNSHEFISDYELFYLQKLILHIEENVDRYITRFMSSYFQHHTDPSQMMNMDMDSVIALQDRLQSEVELFNRQSQIMIDEMDNINDIYNNSEYTIKRDRNDTDLVI